MAVFMLNVCKFNSCGLKFQSLGHLIQHIEETHIDYDPHVVERTEQQQPACIPLSYVLRFLTDSTRREINNSNNSSSSNNNSSNSINSSKAQVTTNAQQLQQQPARPASQSSTSSSTSTTTTTTNSSSSNQRACKSLTPTGSEAEEGEDFLSEPEDSNDSWTTLEEFSQDYILRYGSRNNTQNIASQNVKDDKPFACPVPGCKKRYKNVNGIKYHSKNGHKNDGKVRKAYKCPCGKSYKTPYGLKNHASVPHNSNVSFKNSQAMRQTMDGHLSEQQHHHHHYHHHHSKSNLPKIPKIKVPAIQDHGYMKQEHYSGEADNEYEMSSLGILTPAASPPLPSPVREQPHFHSNKNHHHANSVNSSQTHVRPCDN